MPPPSRTSPAVCSSTSRPLLTWAKSVVDDPMSTTRTGLDRISYPTWKCLDWQALIRAARDSETIRTGG